MSNKEDTECQKELYSTKLKLEFTIASLRQITKVTENESSAKMKYIYDTAFQCLEDVNFKFTTKEVSR